LKRWDNLLEDEGSVGLSISGMAMLLKMEMENQPGHCKIK
jgi:hypothetical protein